MRELLMIYHTENGGRKEVIDRLQEFKNRIPNFEYVIEHGGEESLVTPYGIFNGNERIREALTVLEWLTSTDVDT